MQSRAIRPHSHFAAIQHIPPPSPRTHIYRMYAMHASLNYVGSTYDEHWQRRWKWLTVQRRQQWPSAVDKMMVDPLETNSKAAKFNLFFIHVSSVSRLLDEAFHSDFQSLQITFMKFDYTFCTKLMAVARRLYSPSHQRQQQQQQLKKESKREQSMKKGVRATFFCFITHSGAPKDSIFAWTSLFRVRVWLCEFEREWEWDCECDNDE